MKKLFALLTALALIFSLAACGSSDNNGGSSSSGEPSVTEPVTPDTGSSDTVDGIVGEEDPDAGLNGSDSDTPDNLPANGSAGDVENKPASDSSGGAQAAKPGTTPSGGTSSGSSTSGSASKPGGGASTSKPDAPTTPPAEKSLTDLMTAILDGVETPGYSTTALTSEQFPAYLFIDQPTGAEAVSADAMIGSIAHSVVLLRLPDGADVTGIAKQIKDKADPRKWICVEAEKTEVKTNGNLVLLVMSDTATTDAITANFAALSA